MDLASFKQRYPSFTDDVAIQHALDDAELLITTYDIDESKLDRALGYLTAHLLTLLPTSGVTEPYVTKVKADTVEVQFGDKVAHINDWLNSTSYGQLFALLIKQKVNGIGMVVVWLMHLSINTYLKPLTTH